MSLLTQIYDWLILFKLLQTYLSNVLEQVFVVVLFWYWLLVVLQAPSHTHPAGHDWRTPLDGPFCLYSLPALWHHMVGCCLSILSWGNSDLAAATRYLSPVLLHSFHILTHIYFEEINVDQWYNFVLHIGSVLSSISLHKSNLKWHFSSENSIGVVVWRNGP